MPNFSRLVYVSQAARSFSDAELRRVADDDRVRHERVGITGVLVAGGGQFLQLLEGELEDVAGRFDAIRQDATRHRKVQRLQFAFAAERLFPAWWMGLVDVDRAGPAAERTRLVEALRIARAAPAAGGDGIAAELDLLFRYYKTHLLRAAPLPVRAAG
jgi:hypothetical protein